MIFGREPARWIGLAVALVVAILRVLVGDDLVSPDQADAITNAVTKVADLLLLIAPLIATEITRQRVTPLAEPKLPVTTPVLIDKPAGQVDDTPPPDAVVALVSDIKPERIRMTQAGLKYSPTPADES